MFIDDAAGELTQLRFMPTETTLGYMAVLHDHILAHGVPVALYSDTDAHLPYTGTRETLTSILSVQVTKVLSKNLSCQHKNKLLQVTTTGTGITGSKSYATRTL